MRRKSSDYKSLVFFPRTGYGNEHVQPVYSELQKTNTHIMIGGDFNAQVGSNGEPEAIDCKYFGRHALGERQSNTN